MPRAVLPAGELPARPGLGVKQVGEKARDLELQTIKSFGQGCMQFADQNEWIDARVWGGLLVANMHREEILCAGSSIATRRHSRYPWRFQFAIKNISDKPTSGAIENKKIDLTGLQTHINERVGIEPDHFYPAHAGIQAELRSRQLRKAPRKRIGFELRSGLLVRRLSLVQLIQSGLRILVPSVLPPAVVRLRQFGSAFWLLASRCPTTSSHCEKLCRSRVNSFTGCPQTCEP